MATTEGTLVASTMQQQRLQSINGENEWIVWRGDVYREEKLKLLNCFPYAFCFLYMQESGGVHSYVVGDSMTRTLCVRLPSAAKSW